MEVYTSTQVKDVLNFIEVLDFPPAQGQIWKFNLGQVGSLNLSTGQGLETLQILPRTFGNTVFTGAYQVVSDKLNVIRKTLGLGPMVEEPHISVSFLPANRVKVFRNMF